MVTIPAASLSSPVRWPEGSVLCSVETAPRATIKVAKYQILPPHSADSLRCLQTITCVAPRALQDSIRSFGAPTQPENAMQVKTQGPCFSSTSKAGNCNATMNMFMLLLPLRQSDPLHRL